MRQLIGQNEEILARIISKLPLDLPEDFDNSESFITHVCEKIGLSTLIV